jgi:hypothetical protein
MRFDVAPTVVRFFEVTLDEQVRAIIIVFGLKRYLETVTGFGHGHSVQRDSHGERYLTPTIHVRCGGPQSVVAGGR